MNYQNQTVQRKRALAYIRISSDRQINGESPATQQLAIERYAEQNNIEIVKTFFDEAKSGKNTDRAELQSMIDYARKHRGEIDHVVVYKMSRASRDMASYITGFVVPLRSLNITVRSATEPVDDSAFGQFMEGVNVLIAQLDNHNKRDFTVDNMTSLAHQGYWLHPPIVGYDIHKVQNGIGKARPTLKPNAMAPIIKDVLERFSQGDIKKAELTRYAASKGLRSRYGKKLSEDSINRMLKHPVYAGFISDNFTDYELVKGVHEAIISQDTFEMNQSLLNGTNKRTGEARLKLHPDYPLKGLVLCPNCRNPLYASAPKTGAGGKSPRYHCSRKSCTGLYKSVKAEVMHDDFMDMLKRIKPDERVLSLYREVLIAESNNQLGTLNAKMSGLRTQLSTLDDNRLAAMKKFNADQLTLAEKDELVAAYDEDREALKDELKRLEAQQLVREFDIDTALNVMESVDSQWAVASPSAKQRFQSVLFPKGLVYDYENHRFGTTEISPLYSVIANKKDLPVSEKSFLVAGAGFEPATLWL